MPVDECISAQELAQLFHRYHGVLTGCFDGRTATAPWDQVDQHQRRLLIATARLVLSDLAAKQQAGEAQEADNHEANDHESNDHESNDREAQASETISRKNGNHTADRRYYAKPGQAEWGC